MSTCSISSFFLILENLSVFDYFFRSPSLPLYHHYASIFILISISSHHSIYFFLLIRSFNPSSPLKISHKLGIVEGCFRWRIFYTR
ncbi:hypothetical protein DL98DRAFT_223944 [Cadophora sp. DSE1049]|nr:hypothetical protein DL98DRAFT_223944 [Cadophora sp. DSE1049]